MATDFTKGENAQTYLDLNAQTATFLLRIDPELVNVDSVQDVADKKGLSEKDEFHITIIGSKTAEQILESSEFSHEETVSFIEKPSKQFQWSFEFVSEYYFISKKYEEYNEARESIIQLIDLSELKDFYVELNEYFGTSFDTPFPHLTLFTSSTKPENNLRGIGIYSEQQFRELNLEKVE